MQVISVSKFKATCLAVLAEVKNSRKKVMITKRGEAIAELVPVRKRGKEAPLKDTLTFMGDIVSPVADNDWSVLKE